jgi:hypothetical protein
LHNIPFFGANIQNIYFHFSFHLKNKKFKYKELDVRRIFVKKLNAFRRVFWWYKKTKTTPKSGFRIIFKKQKQIRIIFSF